MARELNNNELKRLAGLLAAQKPREYWEAGRILFAAIRSKPKKKTARGKAWMDKYRRDIAKQLGHKFSVRSLLVCRNLADYWDEKDIQEVEDAGLSLRKANVLVVLDKAAEHPAYSAKREELKQARRRLLERYRTEKWSSKKFNDEMKALKHKKLGHNNPIEASRPRLLALLRAAVDATAEQLLERIDRAQACLEAASAKEVARPRKAIVYACRRLKDVFAPGQKS